MPKISALTDGTALTLTGAELWPGVKTVAGNDGTYKFTVSQALALAGLGPSITTVDNTIPRFDGTAGKLQTSSVVIDDSNNISGALSLTMVAAAASLAAALSITQPSPSGASSTFALNLIKVGYTTSEAIDGGSGPQNSALLIQHRFGGSTLKGGRQSLAVQAALTATSSASNLLREYTSASFLTIAEDGDGGTAVTNQSTHKGTVYGANPYARVLSTSKWLLGAHGLEVNIDVQNSVAGEAPWSVSGISIVPVTAHVRQGVQFDGGVVITGGVGTIGMRNGILFCNASGTQGVAATGSLIAIDNRDADGLGGTTTATFNWGVDFNSGSFTTGAFRSPGFSVNGSGAITGLTYNKVTVTAPASGATLTIADGSSLITAGAFAATLTFTALTAVTFPTSGTLATTAGANIPSLAQGDLLYASASNVLSALNKNTTATRYLSNTGASNNPAWAQIDLTNGVTGALAGVNGGTGLSTAAVGDIIYASATTPTWSRLADVATGSVLVSGGVNTAPAWSASPVVTNLTVNTTTLVNGAVGNFTITSTTNSYPLVKSTGGSSFDTAFQFNNGATNGFLGFLPTVGGTVGDFTFYNGAIKANISAAGGLGVNTASDPGAGMIYTNSASFVIRTKTSYANGAGTGSGVTFTNAPGSSGSTGNPTKWMPFDDNGTTRYVPAF